MRKIITFNIYFNHRSIFFSLNPIGSHFRNQSHRPRTSANKQIKTELMVELEMELGIKRLKVSSFFLFQTKKQQQQQRNSILQQENKKSMRLNPYDSP